MDDQVLFRTLKGRSSAAELSAVNAWRQESVEHERRYRELAAALAAATRAEPATDSTPPSPLKLIHQAESPGAADRTADRTVDRTAASRRLARGRRTAWGWPRWGAAAAAVLALTIWMGRHDTSAPPRVGFDIEEFATGAAEAATVTLRDGTVVRLGPQSRLRVASGKARDVSLWGRALFSVARDPDRPFRIETPAGTVEVLGTRFEIEAGDDDLRIAVIEGLVAVSARGRRTEVTAGEMRRVVGGATLPAVKIPAGTVLGDWVGDFLAFQDTPLLDAAGEIERLYGVRIEIEDETLARQTVTAWFSDQPLEQVMTVFCMVAGAECTTNDDGTITVESRQRR